MKIILTQDVPKLGKKSEVKNVSPGYAKNFLFPKGFARVLTSTAVLELEQKSEAERMVAEKELIKSQAMAAKMDGLEIEVMVKISKDGAAYAAVTAAKIAETLKVLGYNVSKDQVEIKTPIKKIGDYMVTINLAHGLEVEIKVIVVPEE